MNRNLKIGVIVADIDEYLPFIKEIEKYSPEKYNFFKNEGVKFNINDAEVICVHCGIGKVNAAAAAAVLSDKCDIILNFGLSGGISGARKGDICFPDRYLEHDFNLTMIGYKPCEKPGQEYIYSADKKLLGLAKDILSGISGTAACGDRFICDDSERAFLKENFGAVSCDMETAAIASVCHFAEIPFIAIRRISDDAGNDAAQSYTEMNKNEGETLSRTFLKYLCFVCENY